MTTFKVLKTSMSGQSILTNISGDNPKVTNFNEILSLQMPTQTAHLFSAAPELLRIAELILKEWEAPTEGVERGELIARLSQYAAEAREAIRKAKGT